MGGCLAILAQRLPFLENACFYINVNGGRFLVEQRRFWIIFLALIVSACSEGPKSFSIPRADAKEALNVLSDVSGDAKIIIWPQRRRIVKVIADSSFVRLVQNFSRQRNFLTYSFFPANGQNLFVVDLSKEHQKHEYINREHSRLIASRIRRLDGGCDHFSIVSTRLGVYAGVVYFNGVVAEQERQVVRDCVRKALWLVNLSGISPSRYASLSVGSARAIVTAFYHCAEEYDGNSLNHSRVAGLQVKPSVECAKKVLARALKSEAK